MGLVLYALKNRITFYVMGLLILLAGIGTSAIAPKDVLPAVDIPVVVIVWTYTGLDTTDMAQRITTYSEFSLSNNVNDIKQMESQTLPGVAVERIFFQPNVSIDLAIAQVVSAMNSIRAVMPTGVQPPIVVQFNASSVPVLQVSLTSETLNEQQLYDYGIYRLRQQIAPVQGVTVLTPSGGKYRQIMVDLDPAKLLAKGLTPLDIANAINAPEPHAAVGHRRRSASTQYNDAPERVAAPRWSKPLTRIPVKVCERRAPSSMRDVAQVRDGALAAAEHREGGRASHCGPDPHPQERRCVHGRCRCGNVRHRGFLPIEPRFRPVRACRSRELFDQSVFVSGCRRTDVLREGAIAAALTGVDDPALPGLLALHPDRGDDLHPALDPEFDDWCSTSLGETHQHHDARRSGARRSASWSTTRPSQSRTRYRLHGRRQGPTRSHSVVEGAAPASPSRHWFPRSSISCVPSPRSFFLQGHATLPLHAAGLRGRVRDVGVLRPVPDADPHHSSACCCAGEIDGGRTQGRCAGSWLAAD